MLYLNPFKHMGEHFCELAGLLGKERITNVKPKSKIEHPSIKSTSAYLFKDLEIVHTFTIFL